MTIEEELKTNGIEIIEKLDQDTVLDIAKFVASGIWGTFPKFHFNYNDLVDEICNINMYVADLPNRPCRSMLFL